MSVAPQDSGMGRGRSGILLCTLRAVELCPRVLVSIGQTHAESPTSQGRRGKHVKHVRLHLCGRGLRYTCYRGGVLLGLGSPFLCVYLLTQRQGLETATRLNILVSEPSTWVSCGGDDQVPSTWVSCGGDDQVHSCFRSLPIRGTFMGHNCIQQVGQQHPPPLHRVHVSLSTATAGPTTAHVHLCWLLLNGSQ